MAFVRARAGPALLAHEESVDLVQSACREVLKDLAKHDYRDEAGFRHWLFLAAERKILDRARYLGREKRAAPAAHTISTAEAELLRRGYSGISSPSSRAIAKEEVQRLHGALLRLSEDHRQVILLSRVVGMSHAQIAEVMGRTEIAVPSLLHRALARLGEDLGTVGEG
jgi:RNA polymerase sigma-70 factor (ECF subfamily)